jgi:hypothetical protein
MPIALMSWVNISSDKNDRYGVIKVMRLKDYARKITSYVPQAANKRENDL